MHFGFYLGLYDTNKKNWQKKFHRFSIFNKKIFIIICLKKSFENINIQEHFFPALNLWSRDNCKNHLVISTDTLIFFVHVYYFLKVAKMTLLLKLNSWLTGRLQCDPKMAMVLQILHCAPNLGHTFFLAFLLCSFW